MNTDEKNNGDGVSSNNFIRKIVSEDNASGKFEHRVVTRFPPEPNGYLHIGHAKSICLNFGIAQENNSICHLRMDDTNPTKEGEEYVNSIKEDVRWLGFDWKDQYFHASDYFDQLYHYAVELIKLGKAYVCELSAEQMKEYRGTLTQKGKESPGRKRTIEENLALFERMKNGEFEEGQYVLRAKIDMNHPNINMRDPVVYRIRKVEHQRTGNKWCIYPMYDFAHCVSDSIERITHSICTLEFEDHRPLYDWYLDTLKLYHPQQIEFARLNLNYTVMSKRKLLELVTKNYVAGWDDPRMPTISGLRRRGVTPAAIRDFCERIGVTKKETVIDMSVLENCIREDLGPKTKRVLAVLHPLKVVIENYPEGKTELIKAPFHPEDASFGERDLVFQKELYIDRDDFMAVPPKGFKRLTLGGEVRLRYAYLIKCEKIITNDAGEITELRCTYDPQSAHGKSPDGRKVKGIIHWVPTSATPIKARLYDRLMNVANPDQEGHDYKEFLNPNSLEELNAYLEPNAQITAGERAQFERVGYFYADHKDFAPAHPVFNRIVTLRDTWQKKV